MNGKPLAGSLTTPLARGGELASSRDKRSYRDDTLRLRHLGSDSKQRVFYLVGTEQEHADALKKRKYLVEMGGTPRWSGTDQQRKAVGLGHTEVP